MHYFVLVAALALTPVAWSKVSPEQAKALGAELTPIGAERAGLKAGPHGLRIPDWSGGWVLPQGDVKRIHAPDDPYADEEPLLVIKAKDSAQYQDILTPGVQALFAQYPDSFEVWVYPSHRTAAVPDYVSAATVENATQVVLNDSGSGFTGTAQGYPFPIPQNGSELVWNHMARYRTKGFRGFTNSAITTASGDYVVERGYIEAVVHYGNPDLNMETLDNRLISVLSKTVSPPNKAGEAVLIHAPLDREADAIQIWQYNIGTRKVRRISEVGYDNPILDGLVTHDQVDMFNGPLDRYSFKLIGKRPMLVPYNSFELHSPDTSYDDLIEKGHLDPELVRFELHRVWVLEAQRREGTAHIYKKRLFFLDEDSWLILLQDIYDDRDQFWRTAMSFALPYPRIPLTFNSLQAHYDLQSRRYVLINMQNEEETPVEYDFTAPPSHFTQSALKRFASQNQR